MGAVKAGRAVGVNNSLEKVHQLLKRRRRRASVDSCINRENGLQLWIYSPRELHDARKSNKQAPFKESSLISMGLFATERIHIMSLFEMRTQRGRFAIVRRS